MPSPKKKPVPAEVVSVDEHLVPMKAEIVSDKRNLFGRRLGGFAIVLLLLFFSISSYVQSAHNGQLLKRAAVDRSHLIDDVTDLTATNRHQSDTINTLQLAIHQQNKLLRKAGIKTVIVPRPGVAVPSSPGQTTPPPTKNGEPPPGSNPSPTPKPSSNPPKDTPKPHPKPTPSHHPKPKSLLDKTQDRICELTGVCLPKENVNDHHQQQSVRQAQVRGTSAFASDWSAIFRAVADLGSLEWF